MAGDGVREIEAKGVEGLPLDEGGGGSVEVVAYEGVSEGGQVDADLVGAASDGGKGEKGEIIGFR